MIIVASLVAAVLAAAPSQRFEVEVLQASGGQPRVVLAPREGERAVLVVSFAAGAVHDEDRPGLTRVAQHALLEANTRYPFATFVREIFAADGTLQLETGVREASFVLEADRRDFDRLAAILLDLVLAPSLDARFFARARERAMNDERESTGRSDWVALIAPKVIDEARYGNPPHGELDALERTEIEHVRRHLRGPLSAANARIVATGAFDVRALRARLARYRGGFVPVSGPPEVRTPFSLMLPARREIYLLAFKTRLSSPRAAAAARVAAALLEERVHRVFRERGVGYSELVTPVSRDWIEMFLIVLPAHDPSSLPLGTLLEDEVDVVRSGRFTDAELDRNRAWALAEMERVDADPRALARTLAQGSGAAWWSPAVAAQVRSLDRAALEKSFAEILAEPGAIRILYSPRAVRRGPIPESFRRSAR